MDNRMVLQTYFMKRGKSLYPLFYLLGSYRHGDIKTIFEHLQNQLETAWTVCMVEYFVNILNRRFV